MNGNSIRYEFVNAIPDKLAERTIYVAMDFAIAIHKCCCGCGQEVVTPLSPTDWKITYDGVSVSLSPSIGNWSFPCQSHYWIVQNEIRWAAQWTRAQIETGRNADKRNKAGYYATAQKSSQVSTGKASQSLVARIWCWLSRWIRSR